MTRISCIYFLFKGDQLVYIGKSVNLAGRMIEHNSSKDFDYVRYIPCQKELLYHYELRLIKYFKPPLNRAGLIFKTPKALCRLVFEMELMDRLRTWAEKENRSLNNLVETILKEHVKKKKKD